MKKSSALMAMLAMSIAAQSSMSNEDIKRIREWEERQKERPLKPHQKPTPKGMKLYFFNGQGEYNTDHMLKTDVVFECFAINDKNAIKKYNKYLKCL